MKQRQLYRFSKTAIKGGYIEVLSPILVISAVYLVYLVLSLTGAYFLCRYYFTLAAILIWCGARLIMKMLTILLTVRSRAAVIRRCIVRISLPCGYERSIYRVLLRIYFFKGLAVFISRLIFTSIIFLGFWLISTNSFDNRSVYRILMAFQAIPAAVVILWLRLKLFICFAGAEVLSVGNPSLGAWKSILSCAKMLSGQYGFAVGVMLRNLRSIILPFLLPVSVQTLVSYFSVRYIEWQHQKQEEKCYNEQADIYSMHKGAFEAGDFSST